METVGGFSEVVSTDPQTQHDLELHEKAALFQRLRIQDEKIALIQRELLKVTGSCIQMQQTINNCVDVMERVVGILDKLSLEVIELHKK